MEELKPCKCGNKPDLRHEALCGSSVLIGVWSVYCNKCGKRTSDYLKKKKAIKVWNAWASRREGERK